MKFIVCLVIVGFVPSLAVAQGLWNNGSTPYGDAMRGQGRYLDGLSAYLYSKGQYESQRQDAINKSIENWEKYFNVKQGMQDERRERLYGKDYLDKEEHRLNQAERRHALRERERNLIKRGVLPEKPEKRIIIRGRTYKTYKDWTKTYDYVLLKLEHQEKTLLREIDKRMTEVRYKQSLGMANYYESLSYAQMQRHRRKKLVASLMGQSYKVPKPSFPKLERELEVYFKNLDAVRVQIEGLRKFIEINGNQEWR